MRYGVLALLLVTVIAANVPAAPPNVVMIIGDDQAWTDFGFMGHPVIETPNLDRLASQSLVFTRGYVPASLCRPSLATLATGLYAHQHRITSNDPPKGLPKEQFLRQRMEQIANIERVPTLPRMLGEKGYLSHQSGKWWEGGFRRGGFTHGMTRGAPEPGGRHGDDGLKIGREGLEPIFEFIDEAGDRPFFVWYAPFLPHSPHNPPERLLAKYRDKTDSIHVARYWAMCEWFDETCGQLLGFLDKKKLAQNTLVVFVTDNGWIQLPGAAGYAPKSKRSPYDGGLRTPIMLRLPGRIEPARDEKTPVVSIDLAPTILTACGLEATADMQGVDLLDREAPSARKSIFGETFTHNAIDVHDPASSLEYRWCIEGQWKLLVPNAANVPDGRTELYDVLADPHEERNLAGENRDRVVHLRALIDAWWPAR
ncbi:MAG TPA: sulfatase [Thermoguttaceae bacterium]|nr:sulfatase [Thermoguttaceae bacterium]